MPESLVILASLSLSACTFSPPGLGPGPDPDGGMPPVDGAGPDPDARTDAAPDVDAAPVPPDAPPPPPPPQNVAHVPEDGWFGGDDTVWDADVTIDTTALSITGPGVPDGTPGIVFDMWPQASGGPELAVMHVGDWIVSNGVTVRVVGNRPFVVVSSGDIELVGRIDAGARGQTPGAGGAGPGQGQGRGGNGGHDGAQDSGGGGAGHGTNGARGSIGCDGFCGGFGDEPPGGSAGTAFGDDLVSTLTGGSGGGSGGSGPTGLPACAPGVGGAGGGAVQLYALGTITVDSSGGILAGGGGGQGGQAPGECASSAGGGGGSGGVIYVQAERITLDGILAANGGGGGSGAEPGATSNNGNDGALNTTPASGGGDPGNTGSAGGSGGTGATLPAQGVDNDENGGGGGGAVGRVVLHCGEFEGDGASSPAPEFTAGCEQR